MTSSILEVSVKSLSFFRSKIIEAIFHGGRVNTKVKFNYKGWEFWRWEIGDQIVWIPIQNTLAPQELANGFSRFLRSRHCSLQHFNWNLEPANPFITYCLVYQYQDASLIWFLHPSRFQHFKYIERPNAINLLNMIAFGHFLC